MKLTYALLRKQRTHNLRYIVRTLLMKLALVCNNPSPLLNSTYLVSLWPVSKCCVYIYYQTTCNKCTGYVILMSRLVCASINGMQHNTLFLHLGLLHIMAQIVFSYSMLDLPFKYLTTINHVIIILTPFSNLLCSVFNSG